MADIFVTKGAFLKLYSQYIMEYDAKCQLLSESRKKFFEFDRVTSAFEVRKDFFNTAAVVTFEYAIAICRAKHFRQIPLRYNLYMSLKVLGTFYSQSSCY